MKTAAGASFRVGFFASILFVTSAAQAALPAAPTNAVATALSSSQIRLTWRDNSGNESGFKASIRPSGASTWNALPLNAANDTSIVATGLKASTRYELKVRAFNGSGVSDYSGIASDTTDSGFTYSPPASGTGIPFGFFGQPLDVYSSK